MKPPPRNPQALQQHSIDLLCEGIAEGKPYDRLNALREIKSRERGEANNLPASNS